ncbi:hypothetical protein NERG_00996 [Nematocida ausubeli]|uniref:Uncharacterized protein n=1 Tax=Nematocida ausubeli (strain ATCC PRA-371 / ERTm2) TaxID=1913371 RepID=H8ZBP7_NEMA1|nr:hypothetical protein NERG_00996 [Nematocida ausubeli]
MQPHTAENDVSFGEKEIEEADTFYTCKEICDVSIQELANESAPPCKRSKNKWGSNKKNISREFHSENIESGQKRGKGERIAMKKSPPATDDEETVELSAESENSDSVVDSAADEKSERTFYSSIIQMVVGEISNAYMSAQVYNQKSPMQQEEAHSTRMPENEDTEYTSTNEENNSVKPIDISVLSRVKTQRIDREAKKNRSKRQRVPSDVVMEAVYAAIFIFIAAAMGAAYSFYRALCHIKNIGDAQFGDSTYIKCATYFILAYVIYYALSKLFGWAYLLTSFAFWILIRLILFVLTLDITQKMLNP